MGRERDIINADDGTVGRYPKTGLDESPDGTDRHEIAGGENSRKGRRVGDMLFRKFISGLAVEITGFENAFLNIPTASEDRLTKAGQSIARRR